MFLDILFRVVVVVFLMLAGMTLLSVSWSQVRQLRQEWRSRVREVLPMAGVVVAVLLFNRFARQVLDVLSWEIGWKATGTIYAIEGDFIAHLQSIAFHELTVYFSFVYVYCYAFLLIFPVIAYFLLSDTIHFRRLLAAYSFNYVVGLLLYLSVVAYGPRNVMPDLPVVLYEFRPNVQYLTREVNSSTNVFPSLHTSISTTVALFAKRTRRYYPSWTIVTLFLAPSVIISTMYLSIHWATDVVAGALLGILSVRFADRVIGRVSITDLIRDRLGDHTPHRADD